MKVSLIIPTLNSGKTLNFCLDSVFMMSKIPDEIIIIDGGSSDDTEKISKKFNVSFINSEKGLSKQRNVGIKISKYEMIAFLDSDVIVKIDWLSNLLLEIKLDLLAVGGNLIEKNRKTLPDKWRCSHMDQNWGNNKRENIPFLYGSNFLIKKKLFEKVGYFDKKYKTNNEDVDLFKRLKKKKLKFLYTPNAICYHLKKDTIISVMKTNYNWQYYAYPEPKNLLNLILRIFIYNPYKMLVYSLKDLMNGKLINLFLDILMYFFHSFYDFKVYLSQKEF